jgi:hypothetical protein
MTTPRRRQRDRRGAAAVEFAVSVIFLVPLIMYMVTLQEFLIMKFNGQEAAIQATFDFPVLDYADAPPLDSGETAFVSGSVGSMSRLTYCDHSAAFDSFNRDFECDDQRHHKNMTVHECWIGDDPGAYGGQVSCVRVDEPIVPTGPATAAVASFGKGGVMNCTSRLGILNYYLPNSFLNTFRNKKGFAVNQDASGTEKKKMKSRWAYGKDTTARSALGDQDAAHDDRQQATPNGDTSLGSNDWRLARTNHRMLVDTWAVGLEGRNPVQAIDFNNPLVADTVPLPPPPTLYGRITAAYATAGGATAKAKQWNSDLQNAELIDARSMKDKVGDNLTTAAAAFKPNSAEQEFSGHWAGQWSDERVRSTKQARGQKYFGYSRW